MSLKELLFKFNMLNKNFHEVVEGFKKYPKVWKVKYVQEFISNENKAKGKYSTPEEQATFMKLFSDNVFDDHGPLTAFEFFKRSFEK